MQELSIISVSAVIVCHLYQWLKCSRWFPWLKVEQEQIHRAFALASAIALGLGISASYDGSNGTLAITGLTIAGIAQKLGHVAAQWAAQKAWYRLAIAPPSDPKMLNVLDVIATNLTKGAKA